MFLRQYQRQRKCFFQSASWKRHYATYWREQRGWDLVIFDWFVLSMRMQVILDSSFARPGSAPLWGGKKGEFRDWTKAPAARRWIVLASHLRVNQSVCRAHVRNVSFQIVSFHFGIGHNWTLVSGKNINVIWNITSIQVISSHWRCFISCSIRGQWGRDKRK